MNLLPIRYFEQVVKHGSISKAARALFITQQTLSAHMASLERELGCILFVRRPAFRLTHEGEVFHAYCKQFISLDEAMRREFRDLAGQQEGVLRAAISQTRSQIWMPGVMERYRSLHPGMSLRVTEATNRELLPLLRGDEADVAIGSFPEESPEIVIEPLYQEEMCLVIPPTEAFSRLSGIRDIAALMEAARDCPFLMNTQGDIAGRYGSQILTEYGVVPKTAAVSDSAETCLAMCRLGLGLYLCPDLYLRKWEGEDLTVRPLGVVYSIHIAHKKAPYVSQVIRSFLRVCREAAADFNARKTDEESRE